MVQASDTDDLVILVGMIRRDSAEDVAVNYRRVIMDCGSGNTRRYIDVSSIQAKLEVQRPGSSTALIGLHAFTGSDYTAAFFNKGKVKALKLMLESDDADDYIHAFQALSHGQPFDVEKFVCHLYGIKETDHVDAARTAKLFALAGVTKKQFRIEDS